MEYNFSNDTMGRFDSLSYPIEPDNFGLDDFELPKTVHCYTQIPYANFKGETTKYWDLLHTQLNVAPNFSNRQLNGQATLTITPHFYDQDSIVIDAVAMKIDSVKMGSSKLQNIKYKYEDTMHLVVYFDAPVSKNNFVRITIYYTALPYEFKSDGNAAITDSKGIYFINHDLSEGDKPRQIWTQGETQSASHWFPTLDAPNQKTTWEITVTFPDTLVSLSNGKLIKSTNIAPNLKQETWKQELPHSPYLCMLAIGDWTVVKDKWKNKEVNYYVEKKYAPYAKLNFGNTPEMIQFFSDFTGVDFVWDKYSQVVVRDFVSGAMENSGAVVHMEQLQQTPRQHVDQSYEDYVSHELFHHWFGDLVTCESWAHLTLNESWATYGQYLWNEYKYGKDKADEGLQNDEDAAYFSFFGTNKTLTRHDYQKADAGDMFDNISYQKGACILHMLRNMIGDNAFKEGMKTYLTENKFKNAETSDLRKAFEKVTGKDLNWFFNQWYYGIGHPSIQLKDEFTDSTRTWKLQIKQIQHETFVFPVKIKYAVANEVFVKEVFIANSDTSIAFELSQRPDWWVFDSDNALLAEVALDKNYYNKEMDYFNVVKGIFANNNNTAANKYQAFKMARDLKDELFNPEDADQIQLIQLSKEALKINYKQLQYSALQFIDKDVYAFDSVAMEAALLNCASNKSALSDIRAAALKDYFHFTANSAMASNFINDTSLYVSETAFVYLNDTIKQLNIVRKEIVKNNPEFGVNAANTLLNRLRDDHTKNEIMALAVSNNSISVRQFKRLIHSYLPYNADNGETIPSETMLGTIMVTHNNPNFKKAMEEIEKSILDAHQD